MTRACVAIAVLATARVVYLIWLSPYELVADEAQYWDWSRRLALSYYSKGPGIAWAIAASTALFGVSEWAVRLPAAVASVVSAAVVARLAMEFANGQHASRAALVAVFLLSLLPVYQLSAIIMTTDAPLIACWALALFGGWRAYVGERDGRPSLSAWAGCGTAIGAGVLFKYTALLLVPGLIWFAIQNRAVARTGVRWRMGAAGAAVVTLLSPVVVWNMQHDGAGLSHLLGYLAIAGGDRAVRAPFAYSPLWTATFVLGQLGVVGPSLVLFGMSAARVRESDGARFAVCCSVPVLAVFLAATFRSRVEANWPATAYVALIPVAAAIVARVTSGPVPTWWRGAIAYGIAAAIGIHAPLTVASLPTVGALVPTHRFRGFAERARQLSAAARSNEESARDRLIIATSHNAAGLLAFYLPGRPVVASAGRYLGDRASAYDFFDDTDLAGPWTHGRPAVLVGAPPERWQAAFVVDDLSLLSAEGPQWATPSFRGPHPRCDDCSSR